LRAALNAAGFAFVFTRAANLEVQALAFSGQPAKEIAQLFGLPQAAQR